MGFGTRIIFLAAMVTAFSLKIVSAETLYGCPKDGIVMFSKSKLCSDGSKPSPVKEGYIVNGGSRVILNTLTKPEQAGLGIRKDNKLIVVIYKSDLTGEASFEPGKDKLGALLKRNFTELRYDCNGILSVASLSSGCKPLGDTGMDAEAMLNKIYAESKPQFFAQHKAVGLNNELISDLWEKQKKQIYREFCEKNDCSAIANKFEGGD